MNNELITNVIYNIALLLAISIVYVIIPPKTLSYRGFKGIAVGILVGLAGIGIMLKPYMLSPGLFFDARSILLVTAGMFLGVTPTIVATVMLGLFRIYIGGDGVWMGLSVIVLSALIGILWNWFRYEKSFSNKKTRLFELYAIGIVTHIIMLACTFILPGNMGITTFISISIPVLSVYPIGTLVLGMLLFAQADRTRLLVSIEDSEERYRSLFENNSEKMLLVYPAGKIVEANPAACEYYGWSKEELKSMNISDIIVSSKEEIDNENQMMKDKRRDHMHLKHKLASGEERDVEIFIGPIKHKGEDLHYIIVHDATTRRITQKKLEESENRYKVTLLSVGDGVITTDNEGIVTLINRKAREIIERSDGIIGFHFKEAIKLYNEETHQDMEDPVEKAIETGESVRLSYHAMIICPSGAEKPIAHSASPIKDDKGNLMGVVFVFRDVTEERRQQRQIKHISYHDGLTGLYNRSFFDEELKRLDTRRNLPIAVIIGDVNGLKLTNDAFGHASGDKLLCRMSEEIKKACRADDIIARWGGDEFIVLLPKTDEKTAENICERIRTNCAKIKMGDVNFSISLGFEVKKRADEEMASVVKCAEDYMYRKKSIESSSTRGKTIQTILLAFHERNPREQMHSKRVSALCRSIAQAMNMTNREINEMELVGLVHDIGKMAISEKVLNKKAALTSKEWEELKRHPEIGYRILSASNEMSYIAEYILKHHERPDGKGYPGGLFAEAIPVESRILAIADAYDSMTSDRSYRVKIPMEKAIQELKKNSGTQFDPEILDIFINKVLKIESSRKKISHAGG